MRHTVDELMEHFPVKIVCVSVILCINLASPSQTVITSFDKIYFCLVSVKNFSTEIYFCGGTTLTGPYYLFYIFRPIKNKYSALIVSC